MLEDKQIPRLKTDFAILARSVRIANHSIKTKEYEILVVFAVALRVDLD